uniref:Uncharacterized protein n=1 Tax=Onchocerca volvulus TaxID=6282 RepID=A0A8R1TSM9_ONCVO
MINVIRLVDTYIVIEATITVYIKDIKKKMRKPCRHLIVYMEIHKLLFFFLQIDFGFPTRCSRQLLLIIHNKLYLLCHMGLVGLSGPQNRMCLMITIYEMMGEDDR